MRIVTLNDPHPMRICKELAVEIGGNESIIFLQLEFLISISDHEREGRIWTYQSLRDMREKYFPWLSVATVQRAVKRLEELELITVKQFNHHAYDRTQWFALNRVGIDRLKSVSYLFQDETGGVFQSETGCFNLRHACDQNETTIPETTDRDYHHHPPTPLTAEGGEHTNVGGGGGLVSDSEPPEPEAQPASAPAPAAETHNTNRPAAETEKTFRATSQRSKKPVPRAEATDTEKWLVGQGMNAASAHEFRDVPLEAAQRDFSYRREQGTQVGGIVQAWRVCPPNQARQEPVVPRSVSKKPILFSGVDPQTLDIWLRKFENAQSADEKQSVVDEFTRLHLQAQGAAA
jgi:hypothetical protein